MLVAIPETAVVQRYDDDDSFAKDNGVVVRQNDAMEVINRLDHFAVAVREGYVVEQSRLVDIDAVIQIVAELEERRKKLHELLELESIKTSQLRSNFNELKELGEKEISDAILAARQLNIGRIRSLEGEVKFLDDRIEFLKADMSRLEKENKDLEKNRKSSQDEYDKVVQELNKQLMNKAEKQIALNEIRDQIKDTGEKIVEMEEDIIIQKEDLIHEREEAKQEKQRLVINIEDEEKTLKGQQVVNASKKSELDVVLEELKQTKQELKAAKKVWDGLTHDLTMLAKQESELHAKTTREQEALAKLRQQLEEVRLARNEAQMKFDMKEMELNKHMKLLEEKCEYEDGRANEFHVKKKGIEDAERLLKPKVKELTDREAALTAALKEKKEQLREVAERRAELDRRMIMANDQIISNTALHKATMDQLAREFEQTKRILMEVREERDVAREKCDELAAQIQQARDEQAAYFDKSTVIIRNQENTLDDLSRQRDELQNSIKNCERQITSLNQVIESEGEEFQQMKREKTAVLDDLLKVVADLEAEVGKNDEILAAERPVYLALKQEFADKSVECERLKREVVVKKAKVVDLETKLRMANEYIRHFPKLHQTLEEDIGKSDRDFDIKKAIWHKEIMEVERQIVDTWIKLKQAILENDQFNKAIGDVEAKIRHTEGLISKGEARASEIEASIRKEFLSLEEQFLKFKECQNRIRGLDNVDLNRYLVIAQITGDRLECVTNVLDGLNGQLDGMKSFLEVLSGKREENSGSSVIVDDEPLHEINA